MSTSITGITRGPADLVVPPDGEVFRYGIGFVFQVAPGKAGMACNLRFEGFPVGDFEAGTDVVVFDDVDGIRDATPVRITRSERYSHPEKGKRVVVKHTCKGGFVPLGAKRPDGTPHPAAGTGFVFGEALDLPMKGDGYYDKTDKTGGMIRTTELNHLAYDGNEFRVVKTETLAAGVTMRAPGSDWDILHPGLRMGIPDADDLLFPVGASQGNPAAWNTYPHAMGLARWRHDGAFWRPVEFSPIVLSRRTPSSPVVYGQQQQLQWTEPSVARDVDGSLLVTARGVYDDAEEHTIRVWRSTDGWRSWENVIAVPKTRGQAPVTISTASDGTPYIVSCKLAHGRDWLMVWPLNADRTGLDEPLTVRNAAEQFGPPPSGSVWFMDHPNAMTVQLADGQWHNLLAYRIMDRGEHGGADPAPQTGLYVEQVRSTGPAIPRWLF